jgi:copper chaperone CopZ
MDINKITLKITGMKCMGCAQTIQKALASKPGVKSVAVSLPDQQAAIEYDSNTIDLNNIKATIETAGYHVLDTKSIEGRKPEKKHHFFKK